MTIICTMAGLLVTFAVLSIISLMQAYRFAHVHGSGGAWHPLTASRRETDGMSAIQSIHYPDIADQAAVRHDGDETQPARPLLQPLSGKTRRSVGAGAVVVDQFPFRVGRECRMKVDHGRPLIMERRKGVVRPNNDLYMLDMSKRLNVSREHFQIERRQDGTYELVDRGSKCGTGVGSRHVGGNDQGGRTALAHGDVVTVGSSSSPYRFRFIAPRLG